MAYKNNRGNMVSKLYAERELADGSIFRLEYLFESIPATFHDPDESEAGENTYFIDGEEVTQPPEEVTPEVIAEMEASVKEDHSYNGGY